MHISLIGMSNVGKSLWSKRLEEIGFIRYCIDDLIEERLEKLLRTEGLNGIADVARWMGYPYDPQYEQNSKTYLSIERSVMLKVLEEVSQPKMSEKDVVIDTTGSVIYTGSDTLKKLDAVTLICYLETPLEVQEELYQQFLSEPKPLIWGDVFRKDDNESVGDALARSYQELLENRTQEYHRLKNITIDFNTIRHPDYTIEAFLDRIKVPNEATLS
ncbi:MAG: hypothetical protein ACOCXQ_00090 [Patescibacteria group bacterium]